VFEQCVLSCVDFAILKHVSYCRCEDRTERARSATICLHAGQEPDPSTGAIITPIYQTSTYVQDRARRAQRVRDTPATQIHEDGARTQLAAIEGGKSAFAFASGMAAIGAVATMLKSGDHVVVSDKHVRWHIPSVEQVLSRYQLSVFPPHTSTRTNLDAAIGRSRRPRGCSSWNTDQSGHAANPTSPQRPRSARSGQVRLVSTTVRESVRAATDRVRRGPGRAQHDEISQRAQRQHRRIVVATRDDDIEWLGFVQNAAGAILSPFDSWLVLRGTKTLPIRMQQHNAQRPPRSPNSSARIPR